MSPPKITLEELFTAVFGKPPAKPLSIAALLDRTNGRDILANFLASQVRGIIDDMSLARRVFLQKVLAPGELFRVEKRKEAAAFVATGKGIEARLMGRYILPPSFIIGALPVLNWRATEEDLRRVIQATAREMMCEEDKRMHALLVTASTAHHSLIMFRGRIEPDTCDVLRSEVERYGHGTGSVDRFLFQRAALEEELTREGTLLGLAVDPTNLAESRRLGYWGRLKGTNLWSAAEDVEDVVPEGTFYALSPVVGRMTAHALTPGVPLLRPEGVIFPIAEVVAMAVPDARLVACARREASDAR